MLNKNIILTFSLLAAISVFAQKTALQKTSPIKLIERVVKKGNEIVIPYSKYVLQNGLTVILHEDHSDPVVYVDVTYHVGSAREQEGRSGFAHFFEHMMFQGSKHVGDEMHFKYVAEGGGDLNGSTNLDRTNYFETNPNNQLEMMLWLESDRMGFLLDSVTQSKFEVQRSTVINERGQNYDNKPYGLLSEKSVEAFYPKGHPYSYLTIGYIEDLKRASVEDLKRFYMRWYGPNNAVLTVSGDIAIDSTLKLIQKYFGPIPRGPEVKKQLVPAFVIEKDRYVCYEDKIKFPQLKMAWQTVPMGHKDEAALDALSFLLNQSNLSSPFYQQLVKEQKAMFAYLNNMSFELGGRFELTARALEGQSLSQLEKEIRIIFKQWETKGITEDDMLKLKASTQSSIYDGVTTVRGKGTRLAYYQTFNNNPNCIGSDFKKVLELKKEDIMNAYYKYIKGKGCVIASCVPVGKSDLKASESNFFKAERTIEAEGSEYKDLSYEEQNESFDRFVKPASGPNPIVKVPTTWEENFTNGIKLIGSTDTEIPKINLQISIGAGHRFEFPGKAGEAKLLANLMNESTLLHSQQEIDGILSKIGSEVSIYSDENYIHIYVTCLKEKLNTTLQIVDEKIFKSKWDTSEFVRVKKELLNRIKNQAAQPVDIAENAYVKILYGKGHIMSLPENGTEETISSIKMSDVKLYRENYFSPFSTKIVVSGDITKAALIAQIKFLIDWQGKKTIKPYENEIPKIEKTKIYFINKKGAAQSEIRIGFMSLPYDVVGNFYKLKIANFALSGNFNSRLNIQLRETRGYTYGTRGTLKGGLFSGPYTIYGGIKANATDTALMDYMKIIRNYVDVGITDEELQFTKNALGQSEALRYEAPNQKINFLTQLLEYNLSKDFTKKQKLVLAAISKEEINVILKKYMEIDNLNIIVVGDKETLFERVKKLGYEMIELDVNGNPITRVE